MQYKGKNIVANPLITREFGVLIEPQFLDYISAEENLRLLSQLTNQKQDTRIKELLEKTELYSSRKKKVKTIPKKRFVAHVYNFACANFIFRWFSF